MKKAAFFNDDPQKFAQVYGMGRRQRVAEITELYPEVVSADHFASHIQKWSVQKTNPNRRQTSYAHSS